MKQKGFTPILIVILIATLVGGYLFYQNQTKPTTSVPIPPSQPTTQKSPTTTDPTKRYIDKCDSYSTTEYSVLCPTGYLIEEFRWSPEQTNVTSVTFIPNNFTEKTSAGEFLGQITIEQIEKNIDSNMKTEDYIKNVLFKNHFRGAIFKLLTVEKMGNINAYRVATVDQPEVKSAQTFVRSGNTLYYFIFQTGGGYSQPAPSTAKNYGDYEKIIASFKPL